MPLLLLLAFSTQVHLTQREQRTFISSLRSSPRGGNGDVNTVPFQNKMSQWESRKEVSLNHRFNPVCYRNLTRKGSLQYRTDVTFPHDSSSCPTFSPKGNFKKMTAFRIAEDMVIKITAQKKKTKSSEVLLSLCHRYFPNCWDSQELYWSFIVVCWPCPNWASRSKLMRTTDWWRWAILIGEEIFN